MKPHHLKSYLITAVAAYAVLLAGLIAHGAEPLPVTPATEGVKPVPVIGILPAAPAAPALFFGTSTPALAGTPTCTGSACACLLKSGTAAPVSPLDQAVADFKAALIAASKAAADLETAKSVLAMATTADKAAQNAKEAARLALADFIGPPAPKPPEPTPSSHTVEFVAVGGTACKACRAIDKAIADAKAAGVAIRTINVDEDLTAVTTWKPLQLPTIVLLVDGHETNRYPKTSEEVKSYTAWTTKELVDWNARAVEYVKSLPAKKD